MDFYQYYIVLTDSEYQSFLSALDRLKLNRDDYDFFQACDDGPVGSHFSNGHYMSKSDFESTFLGDDVNFGLEEFFVNYRSIYFTFSNQPGGWS